MSRSAVWILPQRCGLRIIPGPVVNYPGLSWPMACRRIERVVRREKTRGLTNPLQGTRPRLRFGMKVNRFGWALPLSEQGVSPLR